MAAGCPRGMVRPLSRRPSDETGGVETDEPLETGYGPSTAPGDNACNDYVGGLAQGYAALARARGDRVVDDGDLVLMDAGSGSPLCNAAVVRRPLSEEGWRTATRRMAAVYGERAGSSYLVFSAWPTPDLSGSGFGRVGHPPLMLRPAGPLSVAPVNGLEIRAVGDEASARDWESTLVHGFPLPELQPYRPGCLLGGRAPDVDGWRHWVGYLDGEPVACASAYVTPTHVDVEFVATLATARGRGIGRALTATATSAAVHRPAMLLASDAGRSLYERLGYRAILRFTLWAGHRRA